MRERAGSSPVIRIHFCLKASDIIGCFFIAQNADVFSVYKPTLRLSYFISVRQKVVHFDNYVEQNVEQSVV